MAVLVESESRRRVILPARCLVGRAPASDLVLADKIVSGQHAVIQWSGALWEVRDLGSRNGTYVDDARLDVGVAAPLGPGSRLRFGKRAATWRLEDADEPRLMAQALATGEVRIGEGGYLSLAAGDDLAPCVYQDPGGRWVVEERGETSPIADRAIVAAADGAPWRIHLPTALASTITGHESALLIALLRLRFAVSRDEEHVEVVAYVGDRVLDLQARAHHYPLLVLARQRLEDRAAGLPEAEVGWVRQDELTRMLRMDDNHLNICIHRARAQLGRLGVVDAASLVERRSGSRQLRLGVRELEIGPCDDDGDASRSRPRGARGRPTRG